MSAPLPGVIAQVKAGLKNLMAPLSPHQANGEEPVASRLQLDHTVRHDPPHREQLEDRHLKLKEAFAEATKSEKQAHAQVEKLTRERRGMDEYITKMRTEFDDLADRYHESERAQQAEEAETNKLRQQLIAFKRSTLVLSRVTSQITDEDVRSKMDMVFYATQDFAVEVLRSSQLDLSRLSPEASTWLTTHRTNPDRPPKSCGPQVVICLVSRVLVTGFAMEHYFGISSNLPVSAAINLASAIPRKDCVRVMHPAVTDPTADGAVADGKAWLEPTRKLIAHMDEDALRKSDQSLVDTAINMLHAMLADALPINWAAVDAGLRKIFTTAFELFRALHRAKATFVVEMVPAVLPQENGAFRPDIMTAVNNSTEDEDALGGRAIKVSVFPVVYKFGNEMGENRDETTVVCKARVVVQKRPRPLSSRK
ncbi:hypothetical protein LTR36_004620 [Oleoguttula mirabilis]|uniref:Uncharacterized protein n=1 Tax=Oleoguttula mirabilis TaxID=1507867 RepID=A0AAV9JGE8_9PEZI|nr:hypothetical protein LTR36_004620 [Oleoguttula mirabilis]